MQDKKLTFEKNPASSIHNRTRNSAKELLLLELAQVKSITHNLEELTAGFTLLPVRRHL